MIRNNCLLLCGLLTIIGITYAQYEPNWDSLDNRPLPSWYDKAKIGIFIHWGVFSVPSFNSEWFWYRWITYQTPEIVEFMEKNYPPGFSYQEFARDFTAEFFNATKWAEPFVKSGAKYVVLTSKHHEGYTLWPSNYSFSWNAKDTGPHKDLVGELSEAVKKADLKFGLYHSLLEWYHPLYMADKSSGYKTDDFVRNKALPELYELINTYQPSVIWSDGEWEANSSYWKSTEFLAWLYNESPVKDEIVTNDRWGADATCHHGGYFTCHDRYDPGSLQERKWESANPIDWSSWGYRRNAKLSDFLSPLDLLTKVVRTVSYGGNILINIGPTKDGIISPIFEERLTQLGKWLDINGEAIYESQPWTAQNDTITGNLWYTTRDKAVYAINLRWPISNTVVLGSVVDLFKNGNASVTLLGHSGELKWTLNNDQVKIELPSKATVTSETAWVYKIIT